MTITRIIAGLISIACYAGGTYMLWDVMSWQLVGGVVLVAMGVAAGLISNDL